MARRKNPKLKSSNVETEYTAHELNELKKCASSAVHFVENYVKIVHPKKGAVRFELYDYQKEMLEAFQNKKDTIVLSSRQTGKALYIKELVATPSGFVKMEDIQVGDSVLGADGYPVHVTAISDIQYNRSCFKIEFSTGEEIIADGEHLWEVQDNCKFARYEGKLGKDRGVTCVVTTQHMYNSKYMISNNRGYKEGRYTVKTSKPLDLPEIDLPVEPYTMGAWLGDGTSTTQAVTNHLNDYYIIEELTKYYNIHRIEHSSTSQSTRTYHFERKLREGLKSAGVLKNKHIPIEYLRASYNQRLQLLQGLMDTDGTVDKRGMCELTFVNERLANDSFHLMCTLGLKPTLNRREINGKLPHVRYTINFTPFSNTINPFKLPRKRDKVKLNPDKRRAQSTYKRTIVKIEPIDSVPVKCIAVDNTDHLFLVGKSLIPTHNSVTSSAFLLWYSIFNFDKTVLIASNKNSNAMEMVDRIKFAYENLPDWLRPGIQEDKWNKHELGFDNNSRIISTATSEDSGRGLAISLLYADELGFVADNIAEEFWTSMTPTLSTGGKSIITSTPNGDSNLFARLWRGAEAGINGYYPIFVSWDRPPGRDDQFKKEFMAKIGEIKWAQEFECLAGDTVVSIQLPNGITQDITVSELEELLKCQH